jgi:CheY-like chemotaxis protein
VGQWQRQNRTAGGRSTARVTVIDDSIDFLQLMEEILRGLGHTMTGLQAVGTSVEEVVATSPDLLVVDLRLENRPQEISGFELLVLARSHRDLLDVPVILCTADLFELKRRLPELRQIAGVHVLTKPFELDVINELVERLLSEEVRPAVWD